MDIIHVLKANTKDNPVWFISNYIDSGITRSAEIVEEIWQTFKKRYGSDFQVFCTLRNLLYNISKIKHPHKGDKIDNLHGLCKVIRSNIERCISLRIYFMPDGMKKFLDKIADKFMTCLL